MHKIDLKGLDEIVFEHTTKEGLKVYIWQNTKVKGIYMTLTAKYGSNHLNFKIGSQAYKVPSGIAHFLEHIKFNVDKDTSAHDIFNKFGADSNAFTTFLYTSYVVFATSNVKDNLNTLLDFVYNPFFTKQLINKEKGIITEEANMGLDNPYNSSYFEHFKQILKKSNYRNEITGSIEDINATTIEDIELVFNTFYHPKNMFLIVTGNVNPYEIAKIVDENLSDKSFLEYSNPKIIVPKEDKKVVKKLVEYEKNVVNYKVKYGIKLPLNRFKDYSKLELRIYFNAIMHLNFGMTSDFYDEIINDGLVNNVVPYVYFLDDYILLDVVTDTDFKDEVVKRIEDKFNTLSLDKKSFLRMKKVNLANIILQFDDIETVNSILQDNIIQYDNIIDNLKEIYESVSYEEANNILDLIDTKENAIYIAKPNKKNTND